MTRIMITNIIRIMITNIAREFRQRSITVPILETAHQTHIRGERSKLQLLALSESTLDGVFTDPGPFARMRRLLKEVYFSRISGNGACPKLEIVWPGLPLNHVTSTLEPKNRAVGAA